MPNAGTSTDRHLRAAISDEQIKFFIAAARVEWRSSKKHITRGRVRSALQCSRFICSSVSSIRSARRAPDFEKISIHITWGSKAPSRNQRINARDLCSSEDYIRIGVTQTNRFIQLTEQLSVFIHSVYRPTFLFLPFQPHLSSMRLGCCSPIIPSPLSNNFANISLRPPRPRAEPSRAAGCAWRSF